MPHSLKTIERNHFTYPSSHNIEISNLNTYKCEDG